MTSREEGEIDLFRKRSWYTEKRGIIPRCFGSCFWVHIAPKRQFSQLAKCLQRNIFLRSIVLNTQYQNLSRRKYC